MAEQRKPFVNLHTLPREIGPIWAFEGEDLDVNLLVFSPEAPVPEHVNSEVDVVGVVLEGEATVVIDGAPLAVSPGSVFYIPKGARRSLMPAGYFVYLTCHKRRKGLWPQVVVE